MNIYIRIKKRLKRLSFIQLLFYFVHVDKEYYFAQALQKMLDAGVDTLIEVGPSSTLIKFAKKIAPKTVKRYAITDLESFNEVKALLTSEEGV